MHLQDLKNCIDSLSHLSGVPMRVLDKHGKVMFRTGTECEACAFFRQHFASEGQCEDLCCRACQRARDISETYVYACPLGLYNAVRAIAEEDGAAAILAGPFLLDDLDTLFIQELSDRYHAPLNRLLDAYDRVQNVKVLYPADANALSRLLNYLFGSANQDDEQRQKMAMQQRRIGESIQTYKGFLGGAPSYPYEKEQQLIHYVEAGNVREANRILNDLLGFALFSSGNDLETIKSWAAELYALLSRTARENGKGELFKLDRSFMHNLWDTDSLENLALLMQEMVERFCQSVFPSSSHSEKTAIARTMRYVDLHYAEPITLAAVAQNVYLSPSYLSSRFKKVMGISFNEYLNMVRINEAKHRLSQGWESVTEIAYAVGYESQSYFSKVFRRTTGKSPSDYQREQHEQAGT